jgi:hypothetical protein
MMSHLTYAVLFAGLISGVEAMLGKRTGRDRVDRAGYMFASSMAAVVVGGWLMFLIHR